MTECRDRCLLLWMHRRPSHQVFVLLSDIQATSVSRTSWLDLSTDPWLWESLGFPCTSFIPGHVSVKFCIILFANSRPLTLCSTNGAPNIQKMSISWQANSSAVCGIFMKSELVVVISFSSHNTTFASCHIFTCHNALRFFKNNQNTKFRVVAVALMPQGVVVFFPVNERFRSLSLTNIVQIDFKPSSCVFYRKEAASFLLQKKSHGILEFGHEKDNTVIPRLTKIIRSGITFVSRNLR